jgi:hypothetical protein
MSHRETIVAAVLTALADIIKTNGYNTDAGANVAELSDTPVPTAKFPALRIADGEAEVTTENVPFGFHEHALHLAVLGYATTRAAAREIVEDVVALMFANRTWSGNARWTALETHSLNEEQADKKIVVASMTFIITYRTALGAI